MDILSADSPGHWTYDYCDIISDAGYCQDASRYVHVSGTGLDPNAMVRWAVGSHTLF